MKKKIFNIEEFIMEKTICNLGLDAVQVIQGFIIEESICNRGLEAITVANGKIIAVANGKIICAGFFSNEAFAKSDLGFNHEEIVKLVEFDRDTYLEHKSHEKHQIYSQIFPNGYKMDWCGIKKWDDLTLHILIKN